MSERTVDEAHAEALRAKLNWQAVTSDGERYVLRYCPDCGRARRTGHERDCPLWEENEE